MCYAKELNGDRIELGNCGLIGAFSSTSNLADKVLTTDGDILYYNSGRQRLAKSTNDKVLQLKSGLPSWQTISTGDSVTLTRQADSITSDESTTSTSLVDTGIAITTNDVTDGKFMATTCLVSKVSGASVAQTFAIAEGSTVHSDIRATQNPSSGNYCQTTLSIVGDTDGDVVTLQMATASDTLTIEGRAIGSGANSYMEMLEIS